jgi:hypothetical protein
MLEGSALSTLSLYCRVSQWFRREDRGVRDDEAQGAHEHEAKEHDLPLVRQGRS